jgi:hypothetical protein
MIGNQILYHGSEINRACKIISNQRYTLSEGDKHWLGDGVYFYPDKILAYRWIWNMHLDRYGRIKSNKELLSRYGVLVSEVKFEEGRVYNLKEIKYQEDYKKIKEIVLERASKVKELSKTDFIDGTILNLMFNFFGYDNSYDIVVALFPNKKVSLPDLKYKSRIWYGIEEQVCVKDEECIISIDILKPNIFQDVYELMQSTYKVRYNVSRNKIYEQ